MKICLKTQAKQTQLQQIPIVLTERLPSHVKSPCELKCQFHVEKHEEHYLLTLNVTGQVMITCQRCLSVFEYNYDNQTQVAICPNELVAEKLMSNYECIVTHSHEIELNDILTDELHLYLPEKHLNLSDCDPEMEQFMSDNM
jgi:uncharacterized protein